jgi:hypothetical protein
VGPSSGRLCSPARSYSIVWMHRVHRYCDTTQRVILGHWIFSNDPSDLKTATTHSHRFGRAGGRPNLIKYRPIGLEDVRDDGRTPRLAIGITCAIAHADYFEAMDDERLHKISSFNGRPNGRSL